MTLQQLSNEIAKETGMTKQKSLKLLKTTVEVMVTQILKGQDVKIPNLGSFKVDAAPEREYFNPHANAICKKPRRFVLKYIPSKSLKEKVNAKKIS